MQSHVGNWGWSIVVLTVLINLAMAPFRHYSIVNGLKMAKLSPEMKVIQERYRKVPLMDPKRQQMQEEIGALYARHGMSMGSQMMVGCLPMLLTMPFLFAFYRVLAVSIELRGAPFLWISDLAQKDPLFLTPVLMGVSMFVMQKMTPSTMDPAQQRIMMLMPLMLAGMFLWAPAGLNLYWLTSNLWSILQQGVSMRLLRPGLARRAGEEGEVKDRVFSGPDVEEALAVAAASLGLPRAELRYVVLDAGTAGRARPQAHPGPDRGPPPGAGPHPRRPRAGAGGRPRGRAGEDPRARLRETVRAVAEAGGLDVEAEVEESEEAVVVRLRGPDAAFFLEPEGRGDVLRATEHLLQRLHGAALQPRRPAPHLRGLPRAAGPGARGGGAPPGRGRARRRAAADDGAAERLRAAGRARRPPGRARGDHLQRGGGVGPPRDGGPRRPAGARAGGAATAASEHRAALEALGLGEGAASRLAAYLDTLAAWSRRVNLTGARTPAERVRLLVGDVLPACPAARRPGPSSTWGRGTAPRASSSPSCGTTSTSPSSSRGPGGGRSCARRPGPRGAPCASCGVRHDGYPGPPARTVTLRARRPAPGRARGARLARGPRPRLRGPAPGSADPSRRRRRERACRGG